MSYVGLRAAAANLLTIGGQLERHPGIPNEGVLFPEWDDIGEQSTEDLDRCIKVRNAANAIFAEGDGVATLEELGALLQYIAVRIEEIKL